MFLATTDASETAAAAEAAAEHAETLDPLSHIFNSEYWEVTHDLRVNLHDLVSLPVLRLGPLTIDFSLSLHVMMLWIAALLLWLLLTVAARREEAHVPRGRLLNFFESIVVFLRDTVVYKVMGPEVGRRYMPFLMTLFFFILFNNLLGLVPGMAAATGNLNVTGTLAVFTLVMTQASGIREHGLAGHLRSLVPPGLPIVLAPVMIPIEIMGMFTKPFALTVRLFANMIAGHIIILAFFGLIFSLSLKSIYWSVLPWAGAVAISAFEIFISFLQAFIFVFLSTIFIHQAVHPEH